MATSLYDVCVKTYLQILGGLAVVLDKGAAHAAENDIDLDNLINARLRDDMLPFKFQVIAACHQSLGCIRGAQVGLFQPPPTIPGIDYAGLQALVNDTIEELQTLSADEVDALADKELTFKLDSMELPFIGEDFLLSFSLPNFFFHVTTTYDMLRINGTPLGKIDFLGAVRFKA